MDMQDNEFDELFRSKLDEFEIEPSAKVWPGIASELHSAKRKKVLMPWLSVAASIIVLAALGVLFITQKTVKNIKKPLQTTIASSIKPVVVDSLHNSLAAAIKLVTIKPHKVKDIGKAQAINAPVQSPVANARSAEPVVIAAVPVKNTVPEVIVAVPQKQTGNITLVPDKATTLTPTLPDQSMPDITTKPALLASQVPVVGKKDSTQVKARHKIHGLAGLVSMVIAKVDKHRDSGQGDDDNESNIVGVNLGLVKIKKGE